MCYFAVVHLQASNAALEKEVDRERKARNQAEGRERELQEKLDRFEVERHKMVRVLDEKVILPTPDGSTAIGVCSCIHANCKLDPILSAKHN